MACSRHLVSTAIILVMLISVNGRYFGNGKKATGRSGEFDPATSRLVKLLQKQTQIDQQKTNFSSAQMIQDFVIQKFQSEMVQLFLSLPDKQRCAVLRNISRTLNCKLDSMARMVGGFTKNINKLKCAPGDTKPKLFSKCVGRNATKMALGGFWDQLGHLFNSVSIPFQCSIVNKISSFSSTTSSKRRRLLQNHFLKGRAPRFSIRVVEKELQKRFPLLNLKQNQCSRVWKPLKDKVPPKTPAAFVNVTIQLRRRRRRKKAWIKRFKKKAYDIYQIYHKFNFQKRRQRPLIASDNGYPSRPPLLDRNHVRLNVIKATKINRSIVVVFALEIKNPGSTQYSKVTPAKQIITPLETISKSTLRRLFGGIVVHLSGRKSEFAKNEYKWLESNTKKAMNLFPKYLVPYYRSLNRLGRCLVMLYISSTLQLELRPVEMFYTSLRYAPRKYFCSPTSRKVDSSSEVSMNIFYRANETSYIQNKKPKPNKTNKKELLISTGRLNVTIQKTSMPSEIPEVLEPDDSAEYPAETRQITPLEIGLFVVLALLCAATLIFIVNCVIFTVKKKSADSTSEREPNNPSAEAIQLKKVHMTRNSKSEGSEPHLQIALLTGDDRDTNKTKLVNTAQKRGSFTRDTKVKETLGNESSLDAVLPALGCDENQYTEDPMKSIENCQNVSSEPHVRENTQTHKDSNGSDNDSVESSYSDEYDCSTDPCSTKIRTTRI